MLEANLSIKANIFVISSFNHETPKRAKLSIKTKTFGLFFFLRKKNTGIVLYLIEYCT